MPHYIEQICLDNTCFSIPSPVSGAGAPGARQYFTLFKTPLTNNPTDVYPASPEVRNLDFPRISTNFPEAF
jgi:hypothetical protein